MQKAYSYTRGSSVGHRAKLGLIVLQTDETIEHDLHRMFPDDGVALYVSRVPSAPNVTTKSLAQMEKSIPASAALLPAIDFDVVGYGCTSGTSVIGAPRVAELIMSGCSTAVTTNPITAAIAACRKLNINSLAFLSPYVEEVSATLRQTLSAANIDTPHFGSFEEGDDTNVAHIDGRSIVAAAIDLHKRGDTDAIFLSCTNLQTLDIITEIEEACDCYVLSSNLVLGWHMLEQAGLTTKTPSLGRLLR